MLNLSKSLSTFAICHPLAFILIGVSVFLISRISPAEFYQTEVIDTCLQEEGLAVTHFPKLWTNRTPDTFLSSLLSIELRQASLVTTPWATPPDPANPCAGAGQLRVPGLSSTSVLQELQLRVWKLCTICFKRPLRPLGRVLTFKQKSTSASSVVGRSFSFRKGRELFQQGHLKISQWTGDLCSRQGWTPSQSEWQSWSLLQTSAHSRGAWGYRWPSHAGSVPCGKLRHFPHGIKGYAGRRAGKPCNPHPAPSPGWIESTQVICLAVNCSVTKIPSHCIKHYRKFHLECVTEHTATGCSAKELSE